MTDAASRLTQARQRAGYSKASDAARAFGWAVPTYLGHENGNRGMAPKVAERYAKAFRVAPAWLMYGTGDMTGAGFHEEQQSLDLPESPPGLRVNRPRLNETNFEVKNGIAEIFAVTNREGIASLRRYLDIIEMALAENESQATSAQKRHE